MKIGKYGKSEISNFRIFAFLRKINGLKQFVGDSLCTKCIKTHCASFCNRTLPYNFYGIIFCVFLGFPYKYEVRFGALFFFFHQKTHFFKNMCPFCDFTSME